MSITHSDPGVALSYAEYMAAHVIGSTETELTISSGAITITGLRHTVDTEGDAASDDLATINGGGTCGLTILRAEHDGRTVVIKHNTGNIWLRGGADISLDDIEDALMLAWDAENSKWFDMGGGGGGTTEVSDDTTPELGGDLVVGKHELRLTSDLSDHEFSGITYVGTAGYGTTAIGDLIYMASADGKWELADADAASTTKPFMGMATQAVAEDASLTVLLCGFIRDSGFSLTNDGAPLFASTTAGDITETAPSGSGDAIRRIGSVEDAANDTIFLNPNGGWGVVP